MSNIRFIFAVSYLSETCKLAHCLNKKYLRECGRTAETGYSVFKSLFTAVDHFGMKPWFHFQKEDFYFYFSIKIAG